MVVAWMLITRCSYQLMCLLGTLLAHAYVSWCACPQALFPSPFYFFDEVDCALDSLAAGRVAAFVGAQCNGSNSSFDSGSGGAAAGKADVRVAATAGADQDMLERDSAVAAAKVAATESSSATVSHVAGEGKGRQVASRIGAQYLLVSHRPVVFESAGCLLGVYSNGRGSSAAVVAHF
jgi:hypothetical protein